jgi:rubrerythrin
MFAAELLAPTAVLRACNCTESSNIEKLCKISTEASEYAVSDINRDTHLNERDKNALERQFHKFISSEEYSLITIVFYCSCCGALFKEHLNSYCSICGTSSSTKNIKAGYIYSDSLNVTNNKRLIFCPSCGNYTFKPGAKKCPLST